MMGADMRDQRAEVFKFLLPKLSEEEAAGLGSVGSPVAFVLQAQTALFEGTRLESPQLSVLAAMLHQGAIPASQFNRFIEKTLEDRGLDVPKENWTRIVTGVLSKYYSRANGMTSEDLDDAVQSVFTTLFGDGGDAFLGAWDPKKAPFTSWLVVRARQLGIDEYRKIKRRMQYLPEEGNAILYEEILPSEVGSILKHMQELHEASELRVIFNEVRRRDRGRNKFMTRTMIRLALGETQVEISKGLGIPKSSITAYLKRLALFVTELVEREKIVLR